MGTEDSVKGGVCPFGEGGRGIPEVGVFDFAGDIGKPFTLSDEPLVGSIDVWESAAQSSEVVIDMVCGRPVPSVEVLVDFCDGLFSEDCPCVGTVDIEGFTDRFIDDFWLSDSSLQVLSTVVNPGGVGRESIFKIGSFFGEIFAENGIIFEDEDGLDIISEAVFKDVEVGAITSPGTATPFPPGGRWHIQAVNGLKAFDGRVFPIFGEVFAKGRPFFRAAFEVEAVNFFVIHRKRPSFCFHSRIIWSRALIQRRCIGL